MVDRTADATSSTGHAAARPGRAARPPALARRTPGSPPPSARCCPPASTSTPTPPCWRWPTAGARSQQSLADTTSVSRTTMTRVAADLAAQGLVERVRNPTTGAPTPLTRTPGGAAPARRWRRHARGVEEAMAAGFTPAEREELRDLLLGRRARSWRPRPPTRCSASIGFLVTGCTSGCTATSARAPPGSSRATSALAGRAASPGRSSQAELARAAGLSGRACGQIVDHPRGRGLVERRRLPRPPSRLLHLGRPPRVVRAGWGRRRARSAPGARRDRRGAAGSAAPGFPWRRAAQGRRAADGARSSGESGCSQAQPAIALA